MTGQLHRGLGASVIAALVIVMLPALSSVSAQGQRVDPKEIALALTDAPSGFQLDPGETRADTLSGIGESYTLLMRVEPTEQHLSNGPVAVWQRVLRVDKRSEVRTQFRELRDQLMDEQGLTTFPGAENGGGFVQLIGQEQAAGAERDVYAVGQIYDNVIAFTLVRGTEPGTTIQSALDLNDRTLVKFENFRIASPAYRLGGKLFNEPFGTDELPEGFEAGNLQQSNASERAESHGALGEIDLHVQGPGVERRITYIVYSSDIDAEESFAEAPARAEARGSTVIRPEGIDHPALCAVRGTTIEGRKLSATMCVGLLGSVEISGFYVSEGEGDESMATALKLMSAGVAHLHRLAA